MIELEENVDQNGDEYIDETKVMKLKEDDVLCDNNNSESVTIENGIKLELERLRSSESSNLKEFVIVTGSAGFIGSHVATHCLSLNLNVIVIDDLSGGFLSNIPKNERIIFEKGSVTNSSFIDSIFVKYGDIKNGNKIRFIYHLAAYAAEGLSHFIRRYNFENNLMASTLLINYAINYNVECFIFTSSIAMYGSGPYKD